MKITAAEFIRSVYAPEELIADDRPQIAFAGRSNVGKSSLLNTLLNRKKLAFVSSTPGKTQCINFYLVNDSFYFVDLPGYGYAAAPKSLQKAWHGLIETFLRGSSALRLVVSLIDIRHDLSPLDAELWAWLQAFHKPVVVVGTKADKLNGQQLREKGKSLAAQTAKWMKTPFLAFSSYNGLGKADLWGIIRPYLG